MSGIAKEFKAALESEFGSAGNQYNAIGVANAKAVLLFQGPCEVYDWAVDGQTSSAVFATLQDASATGEGSTVRLHHFFNPNGRFHYSWRRPVVFDKGLVLSFTATGSVAAWSTTINWSPLPPEGRSTKRAGSATMELS